MLALTTHGIGGRTDLPLPVWMFAYGAGGALVLSFIALGVLWRRPLLTAAADGRPLPLGAAMSRVGNSIKFGLAIEAFLGPVSPDTWITQSECQ